MTFDEVIADIKVRLTKAGVDNPRLDARLLVQAALKVGPEYLLAHGRDPLTGDQMKCLEPLVARREAREPMAQITGRHEFWSLEFSVSNSVLCPRPDSETLIEAVMACPIDPASSLSILDLGVGSGCLLLSLLHEWPSARGIGIDQSIDAIKIASENAQRLGLEDRCQMIHANWLDFACRKAEPFDLIISNPPYIPTGDIDDLEPEVRDFEPLKALDGGIDGLDCYRQINQHFVRFLKPGGFMVMELGVGQAESVAGMFSNDHTEVIDIKADLSGVARAITVQRTIY